jgi:RNA polymerase sigma factor (sigma-70 family)
MDDREVVAAIAAGDLAGLADAYDQYAESLYGYCHWMLNDPADAADALQDTFVVAAGRLGGLRDPRKLHPWLYAVARNECRRRLGAAEAGPDEAADAPGDLDDPDDDSDRAELRRRVRSALSDLGPDEREVLELELRHDLHGADLAAVLGVSRNQAHSLVVRTRDELEKDLGALLVARTGRRDCRALDTLLADGDGRLTAIMRKRIGRHADQCEVCGKRRRGTLRNAALFAMAPLAVLPGWSREDVLGLCSDTSAPALTYRQEVTRRAGPFGPNGFPQPIGSPRRRALVLARIAAAAGIVIAVTSAGIITALALTGSHVPHSLDAVRGSSRPVTGSAPAAPTGSAGTPAIASPTVSQSTAASQDPAVLPTQTAPSAPATTAKPSPSPSKSASASATPTPTPTPTVTAPTPTPTSTATTTPFPTPTVTPSF